MLLGERIRKLKALLRGWTTRPEPLDPSLRYPPRPSLYGLVSIGIIIVELFFFFVEAPYDTIPNKPVFWLAFVGWALPPIIIEWAYVNAPSKREVNAYTNMMIGMGLLAITLGISVRTVSALIPVVAALVPGALAGGLVGSDTTLVWKLRKAK